MGFRHLAVLLVGVSAVGVVWGYWPTPTLPTDVRIDRVVVDKSARRLELLSGNDVIASYRVALGRHPDGPKLTLGDGRTPEGDYMIDYRNLQSRFHRALHISYPSAEDVRDAHVRGVEPGGMIMIHGVDDRFAKLGRFHTFLDWTDGCIAVTNAEVDQIYKVVVDGTPIHIAR
jgi:murein L,D-transpeptidase YafK